MSHQIEKKNERTFKILYYYIYNLEKRFLDTIVRCTRAGGENPINQYRVPKSSLKPIGKIRYSITSLRPLPPNGRVRANLVRGEKVDVTSRPKVISL